MRYPVKDPIIVKQAKEILGLNPVFLDTETTGLGDSDRIIEVAIVDLQGTPLLNSLINPGMHIPFEASRVNHITNDMVTNAPLWREIWPKVEEISRGRLIGIYNAEYDLRMLSQSNKIAGLDRRLRGIQSFCVMQLYSEWYGERNPRYNDFMWHKLEVAGRVCKIKMPISHRAVDDARLTAAVMRYIAESR